MGKLAPPLDGGPLSWMVKSVTVWPVPPRSVLQEPPAADHKSTAGTARAYPPLAPPSREGPFMFPIELPSSSL